MRTQGQVQGQLKIHKTTGLLFVSDSKAGHGQRDLTNPLAITAFGADSNRGFQELDPSDLLSVACIP